MKNEKKIDNISENLDSALMNHNIWRNRCINLVASESILWDSANPMEYKDLSRRAILGVPGQRYSEGGKYIDTIEQITDELLKDVFKAKYAEWRPISGSIADAILIHAFTSVNDKIVATPTPLGHPTWHESGYSGFRGLKITDTPYNWETLEPDYERLAYLTSEQNFNLLIEGSSLILFPPDFSKLKKSVNEVPIWYDGAHVLGLIIGNEFPNPLNFGIEAISGSTQKTMAGPLGGVILTNNGELYNKIVFTTSNDMATPDYSRYIMLARTILNWKKDGKILAKKITKNAKTLAEELVNVGMKVILEDKGYTSTHQIGLVAPASFTSEKAAKKLSDSGIITTPFPLPKKKVDSQILRLGVTEITQMGFFEDDMNTIATAIKLGFTDPTKAAKVINDLIGNKANALQHNNL